MEALGLGIGLLSSSVASSADLALHELLVLSDSLPRATGSGRLHFFGVGTERHRSSAKSDLSVKAVALSDDHT